MLVVDHVLDRLILVADGELEAGGLHRIKERVRALVQDAIVPEGLDAIPVDDHAIDAT
ncbi:MAG: hypothetical protein BWY79_00720 [Actinobacteria bacterium ADurb.Bin444]|nr:MAG: hypothetical protein BWY79_00720 [Actinobacteria bacterium ADurb.Bin444]